jgi:hypothetical protein
MSGAVAEICRGGKHFTSADTEERKQLFTTALPAHVPLARLVRQVLDERGNHRASAVRFRDELEDHIRPIYAKDRLRTVIGWGRDAELLSYDEEAEQREGRSPGYSQNEGRRELFDGSTALGEFEWRSSCRA